MDAKTRIDWLEEKMSKLEIRKSDGPAPLPDIVLWHIFKELKEEIELLQLTEEKRRLLTRVAELALEECLNRKMDLSFRLSLRSLPDMINDAHCLEQLADLEKIIEEDEKYLKNFPKLESES